MNRPTTPGQGEPAPAGGAAAPATSETERYRREPVTHPHPLVAERIELLLQAADEAYAAEALASGRKPRRKGHNHDLLREVITYAVQAGDGALDRGELKILAATLRDFISAFRAFGPYRDKKKVAIFGSARTPIGSPVYEHCKRLSAALAARGYMVITGAGPGIMRAGHEGAGREHSFGVQITLPFEQRSNDVIEGDPKLVKFKYFFTRKLSFVKESDAIVLYPGGFGTMDEWFESLTLLQTGKCDPLPVLLLDVPGSNYWPSWERYLREHLLTKGLISPEDRNLFRFTTDVDKAVGEIELFYSSYHSLRYVGDYVVLRLRRHPAPALLDLLNERYRDLLAEGDFHVMDGPHPAERSEPAAVRALPRIGFHYVQRRFGSLRRLIDDINLIEGQLPEPPAPPTPAPQGGHLVLDPEP